MKEPPVVLPPLKLHKGAKYTYVFTYRGVWEPAVKDEAGNIIKKGRARSVDRKTVGKIDDGQHTGVIKFYDAFLNDYPELKNYIVIRNSDGTFTFNKRSEVADNAKATIESSIDTNHKPPKPTAAATATATTAAAATATTAAASSATTTTAAAASDTAAVVTSASAGANAAIPVVLPPLKLHKGAKYTYVFTYRGVWEPAVKDEAGNIIKKGRARSVDRKTVGKIDDGQHTGVIKFYDAFLKDYPELKNYIVVRNSDGTFTFHKLSEKEIHANAALETAFDTNHKTINKPQKLTAAATATAAAATAAAAAVASASASAGANDVTVADAKSNAYGVFLGTKKAGAIVYLDHLSYKTGVRAALIKAFSESTDAKLRNATKFANFIETVLYSMLISGENTLDSLPKFCSEYVLANGVLSNKTTLLKCINQIDEAFVEKFNQNFIQEYLKNNSDSYKALKNGLMVFATSTEIDNALHSQLNIQFICDADKSLLPICYEVGSTSAGTGASAISSNSNKALPLVDVKNKFAPYDISPDKVCIVADKEYYSDDNIASLLRSGETFIFNCKLVDGTVVQEVIDKAISQNIYGNSSFSELKSATTTCESFTRAYRYDESSVQDKRDCKKATAEIRYHVFFDSEIHFSAVKKLKETLCKLSNSVKNGKKLTPKDEELLKKYSNYDLSKYVEGKPNPSPEYSATALEQATKYEGFWVLATNDFNLTSAKVLERYKSLQAVDTLMHSTNELVVGSSKAKQGINLHSHIFLQYVVAIFKAAIRHDIDRANTNVGSSILNVPTDNSSSYQAVFEALNGITVDEYANGIVCKPIAEAHALILKCLGVPIPKSML